MVLTLAEAVLPLIRGGRRDLWRYAEANDQGGDMLAGAELLEAALEDPAGLLERSIRPPTLNEVYSVARKAVTSAIRVIGRADDSSGIIGTACRDLIGLHVRAAILARPPVLKLADWVFDFHFDDRIDYFELDPVAYAPALGDKGLARLRARVEELRARVLDLDQASPLTAYDHRVHVIEWFDMRFAVLDRDHAAIVRTHLRDGRTAAFLEDVAMAFLEIEEIELAIYWIEDATMFGLGHPSRRAAERWRALVAEHRPAESAGVTRTIFTRWPTSATAAEFVAAAGPDAIAEAEALLDPHRAELVKFQLGTLNDPRRAWATAATSTITDNSVWASLADACLSIHPVPAIRIKLQLVDHALEKADASRYWRVAGELARIRDLAIATSLPDALTTVDAKIAELRERYRRRWRLLGAFEAAQLP